MNTSAKMLLGLLAGAAAVALLSRDKVSPGPVAQKPQSNALVLPGGFKVGDRVLLAPSQFINAAFPVPGQTDFTSPVLAVVTDPGQQNLFPFGVPSLVVLPQDARVPGGFEAIVPLTSVLSKTT